MTEYAPILISLLASCIAFMVIMALRATQGQKQVSDVGAALVRHGAPSPDLRSMQLTRPWSERVLKPMLRKLYRMGRYLTPSRNIEQLQHNLIVAGLPAGLTVTDFLGLRFLAGASIGLLAFTIMLVRSEPSTAFAAAGAGFLSGLYIPNYWLNSRMRSRKAAIARALPDALDMMSICVDAGLGFEAAIQKVAFQWSNQLALEMRRVISEIRVGVPRSDALHHLAERTDVPEVASFVAVLIQADKLGIPIRNVLSTQSIQMRIRRRQRAEEEAGKAPIKMMFPMVLFIFPAMFAVILGPAIPRLMAAFQ